MTYRGSLILLGLLAVVLVPSACGGTKEEPRPVEIPARPTPTPPKSASPRPCSAAAGAHDEPLGSIEPRGPRPHRRSARARRATRMDHHAHDHVLKESAVDELLQGYNHHIEEEKAT